jgi:hypothetical protein
MQTILVVFGCLSSVTVCAYILNHSLHSGKTLALMTILKVSFGEDGRADTYL